MASVSSLSCEWGSGSPAGGHTTHHRRRGFARETALKECLTLDPASVEARRRLVFLYAARAARDELRKVLWELHGLGAAGSD